VAESNSTTRAAVYLRRSSNKQEDSIERQRSTVLPHCERRGYRLAGEYRDEGIAGDAFGKRSGFQRLLADARAGEFDVIVCDEISRLSRQKFTEFMALVAYPLEQAGVTVDAVQEGPLGWDEVVDILKLTIYQTNASGETRKLSYRVLTGQANAARARRLLGGPPPYGYMVQYERVEEPGKPARVVPVRYVPDPRTAHVILWLFERYASGAACTAELARELNARGAPAPCRRNGRRGKPPPEPLWTRQAVRFILRNPKYTGCLTWNRRPRGRYSRLAGGKVVKLARGVAPAGDWVVTENAHEALVSRELFDRVQDRLAGNRGGRLRAARKGYLLSGLLVCSHCGRTLTGRGRYGRPAYHCRREDNAGRAVCRQSQVQQDAIVRLLLAKLQSAFLDPDNLRELRAEIRRQEEADRRPERLDTLRRAAEDLDRKLTAGAENLLLCPPSVRDRAANKLVEWETERDRLREELRQADRHSPVAELEAAVKAAETWLWKLKDAVEEDDPAELRQVLRETVVRVELKWEDGPQRRHLAGGVIVYRFGGQEAFAAGEPVTSAWRRTTGSSRPSAPACR
jgi:DNA invertase Pin-like site-specific DNA recombinase